MKSSVLAVLMLMMVLSFGINAFAAVSKDAVNARLNQLVPSGQPALMALGATDGGKECEIGLGADGKGDMGVMVSVRSMMGTKHFSFNVAENRTLTAAADRGNQIVVESVNSQGLQETLVVGVSNSQNGRELRSVEIIAVVDGFFGTSTKSLIKCSL